MSSQIRRYWKQGFAPNSAADQRHQESPPSQNRSSTGLWRKTAATIAIAVIQAISIASLY